MYNTLIVRDGGLGGGVYGGRGSAQDSCTTYARMCKYDELSSCRSITTTTIRRAWGDCSLLAVAVNSVFAESLMTDSRSELSALIQGNLCIVD